MNWISSQASQIIEKDIWRPISENDLQGKNYWVQFEVYMINWSAYRFAKSKQFKENWSLKNVL